MIKGTAGDHNHPFGAVPFEAFHNGSWHGVNSIRIRNGGLFVKFVESGSAAEHNIDGDYLRLHSRKANCLDCSHVLRPGADVCVKQANSREEANPSVLLYRDARLIKIKQKHHTDQCLCLFTVMFYKDQCPGSKGKVTTGTLAKVVTAGDVFILQKLHSGELHDGSVRWSSAEDCFHHNRSKLLSARFSTEVTHLIVLSSLRGMEFSIKVVEGKIIYQIIKGDQERYSDDSMSIPPGFGKSMDIISFKSRAEALRPRIITVPVTQVNKHNFTEDRCTTVMDELDTAPDVEVLYENVDLRRSKRMRTQPDRFTSYDAPNFNRTYKKKEGNTSSINNENSQSDLSWDSPVQGESSDEEVLGNPQVKQTVFGPFMVKEDPSSMEGQRNNPMKRTKCSFPVKEKPTCVEMEKNTAEQRSPDPHIPPTPAKNKEKRSRPPLSFRLKPFTSSHSQSGNSEPAFCQKRGRKRKKHMCEREYKEMIDQCIGNIQCEMERDSGFKLDVQIMNCSTHAYQEGDFTWPPSTDSHEDKDEFEELWKEMDYALDSIALLEQKQMQDSEAPPESNTGLGKGGHCHHDCILDEQLGLTCRLCNVVCIEAKDIFPPMFSGKDHERHGRSGSCQDDHVLDFSFLDICAPEFTKSKGSGNVWASITDLEPKLHAHQRKAFEFIWKNLAGSLQLEEMDDSTTNRGGCVVAHTPGAGKTLLLISFLVSYLKVHPRSRPLVLTPKSAIHTWRREFETWGISLPLHVLHYSNGRGKAMGTLSSKARAILKNFHQPSWKMMRMMDSLDKLCKWHENPSILLMTYHSFLALTKEDTKLQHRVFMAKVLMNNPGLLILDEGHNPRSNKSKLRKLLMKVKTEFRILLSGTVFQNNFEEYFNTLSLARPRFVSDVMTALVPEAERETRNRTGKHQEAVARRIFVEKVGQKIESCSMHDIVDGISLLNKLTCGFIDIFEGTKENNLPGIRVYTIFMKPTDVQEEVLAKVRMPVPGVTRYPLEVELLITIASIHPWLIKTTRCASTYFTPKEVGRVEKYKQKYTVGCKTKFVIDLLHKSSFRGERVLIFCHNVSPINFLVKLIEIVFGWRLGEEVLVLQGEQELPVRSDVMDKFNGDKKGKRKVLIASTTACAEGISLTGASRLVMLDSEWNHSKTMQAIARAFRPGQERMVNVYLLVASGTWEEDKYNSNRRKARIAKMVFFGRYVDEASQNHVTEIDDEVLKELADEDQTKAFHKIVKQDVKMDIFNTFIELLRQTGNVTKGQGDINESSPRWLLKQEVPKIVKSINRQLREKSIKTKVGAFSVLKELVVVLPDCLADHFGSLVPGIEKALTDKSSTSNLKIEALVFTRLVMASHSPSVFHPYIQALSAPILSAIGDRYYKVTAEALRVCGELVRVLRPNLETSAVDFRPYIGPIYKAILGRLANQDQDQEVKESAISCMSLVVSTFGDGLQRELPACLPILVDRMGNEITRLTAVKAFSVIANSPLRIDLSCVLDHVVSELTAFLRKANRALRQATLGTLNSLVVTYGGQIGSSSYETIIAELSTLISDMDLHMTALALELCCTIMVDRKSIQNVGLAVRNKVLPQALILIRSALLQGQALQALQRFFASLVQSANTSFDALLDSLISVAKPSQSGGLAKQALSSIAKCVAVLCLAAGDQKCAATIEMLKGILKDDSSSNPAKQHMALLCLGEIGRRKDLSNHAHIENIVIESFQSPFEEIKSAASYALGNIAVGNLSKYLPFILDQIDNQQKKQYLLLHSLKEVIVRQTVDHNGQSELQDSNIEKILALLFNHCESEEEGVRNVVAECLGKIALIEPKKLIPALKVRTSSPAANTRATVAIAIKYSIVERPEKIDEIMYSEISTFLMLIKDNDRHVRRAAVLALSTAAHNKPNLIKGLLPELLPLLYDQTVIKQELIRTVDLGPFKHVVDDGLELRKAAFECVDTLLDSCLDQVNPSSFIVPFLLSGLGDHYDVKMPCHLILSKLADKCPSAVLAVLDSIVEPIEKTISHKPKGDAVKQEVDRNEDMIRSALRAISSLSRISGSDYSIRFKNLMNKIVSTPALADKYNSVRSE